MDCFDSMYGILVEIAPEIFNRMFPEIKKIYFNSKFELKNQNFAPQIRILPSLVPCWGACRLAWGP